MFCPAFRSSLAALGITLALMVTGCAASTQSADPRGSEVAAGAKPAPKVADCGIITISSPSKYVCNGKTYTSYQLTKLRTDQEKQYASGK